MKSKLKKLRSRLKRLKHRRSFVRCTVGLSAFLLTILWALIVLFLIDWTLDTTRLQRTVVLCVFITVTVWSFWRFLLPVLRQGESLIDVALLVEKTHGIKNDLVAALQFETADAPDWGSTTLRQSVIDQVASSSAKLDVFRGFTYGRLGRRLLILAVTLVVIGLGIVCLPRHMSAFLDRMLLGATEYPTRTVIEKVTINGQVVFPTDHPARVVVPFGKRARFQTESSGHIPKTGLITLVGRDSNARTTVPLNPAESLNDDRVGRHAGEVDRLVASVSGRVVLGDAHTDDFLIDVIPLPLVTVALQSTPPAYVQAAEDDTATNPEARRSSSRHIAVVEGSRVDIHIECVNKSLNHVRVTLDDQEATVTRDGNQDAWSTSDKTPALLHVDHPMEYSVQVEDEDGLSLESPIKGSIRIRPDRRPRVVAKMLSKLVMPTARPRLSFGAVDDYGLAQIRVRFQIDRHAGDPEQVVRDLRTITPEQQPVKLIQNEEPLELTSLQLNKGDELKITLEAYDYRGDLPSQLTESEPLILQVTDRQGILAGMLESDEESARRLDEIIQRELGIGETK